MRLKLWSCVLTLSLLVCSASRLPAADAPDLIPASASAVLRLQAPQTSLKEISAFIDDIQPGYGVFVSGQAGMLGVGISNPTMQGVDQSRDWYAAIFLKRKAKPEVVFVIPATDVKALGEAIDKKFTFHAADGYGIYSESAEAVDKFKTHLSGGSSQSVNDLAGEKLKEAVTKAHISLAFNLVNLKETFSEDLSEFRSKVAEGINQALDETPESVPGLDLAWVPGFLADVVRFAEVAVEDSQAYAVGLTLDKSGLLLKDYLEFADGSRAAGFLAKHPPAALVGISKLPANQIAYSGSAPSLSELSQVGIQLLTKMVEQTDEQAATWSSVQKQFKDLNHGAMSGSFGLGNFENGLFRSVTIGEVSDSTKVRGMMKSMVPAMNALELPGLKQTMTLDEKKETIDGTEVDLLTVDQEFGDGEDMGGLQAQFMQIFYGDEGPVTRVAYLKGAYVQTVGGGTESTKAALDAYKAGAAGKDNVVTRDLKPLGTENNFVGLFDLQTLVVDGLKLAMTHPNLPPLPLDEESLDELKIKRSYIGVSGTIVGNGYAGTLHIPKETISSGIQLFMFFQETMQRNRGDF